ncbi:two pore domain potassium channel family protein [Candidatus Poribacteria bacterium]|nr:two pore domain potassium channel family protein [Candidatus Poribacteria bacterium]MBT5710485.1 two pore domain potassium channel family protein [Candidatus Poribacteria bacterium]MBT7098923.1 two pore domain potassium channel family protein [Candidatus Poribacteria bacterium]MBT7805320.1 two pore domain potassium channel family protein [Candidatus Poribacteria bacterium]
MILFFLPARLSQRFKDRKPLVLLLDLLFLGAVVSAGFIVLLRFVEDVTWEESIWQVWQTATTVGYGNRPAQTSVGRYATMAFGLMDIAIVGAGIGAVFDAREDKRRRTRLGLMDNPHRDGYVVFNLPGTSQFMAFVHEIRHVEPDAPVCVVDDAVEQLPESIAAIPRVHFVKGSVLDKDTYTRAKLADNKVVIVFPTHPGDPSSDGTTRVAVDLILDTVTANTRVLHVLVSPDNDWMFSHLASTAVMETLEVLAIVQECQDVHSADIVQRLLLNTQDANPMTVVPERIVGWTWQDFVTYALPAAEACRVEINPFAIIKDGVPQLCPSRTARIEEGDLLSVIALTGLDWAAFEEALVRARA